MKLLVLGFGQCGGRLADEFARLNKRARSHRGIEILTGAFAVDTDVTDLGGLATIGSDYQHRMLIGGRKTGGHGVGKINEVGAVVAREDADKVVDAIRTVRRLYETDAFLLIGSSGGGTGSGCLPIITRHIKERFRDKPVWDLIVLPFEHEEATEERAVYNSATCLKSVSSVADAVFLVDNQRYVRKALSLRNNMNQINSLIVEPFYNLLCAGEEKKAKWIGAKTLDTGDIVETMTGWTVFGRGEESLPRFSFSFRRDFRKKGVQTHIGVQAMDEALTELSLKCDPASSGRALYLISAPAKEMNMDLVKELGDYLKDVAPEAIIRNGDYPREKTSLDITLVMSELSEVEKIKGYYSHSTQFKRSAKKRRAEVDSKLKELEQLSKEVPLLLHGDGRHS